MGNEWKIREYTYFNFYLLNIIAKGVNVYKKGVLFEMSDDIAKFTFESFFYGTRDVWWEEI